MASPTPASRRRRRALIACLALVALCAVAYFEARRRVAASLHASLDAASQRLGRAVTVRSIRVGLVPRVDVSLLGLSIAPARGASGAAAQTPFTASEVRVRVALWPLLRSRGRDVVVESLALRAPFVTLALLPDGSHSLRGLAPPAAPSAPRHFGSLRSLRIDRVTVSDGALRLVDASDPTRPTAPLTARSFRLVVEHLGAHDATVYASAALLGGETNLRARVLVGPMRTDADGVPTPPSVRRVEIDLRPVQLSPLLQLPARRVTAGPSAAVVSAHARIEPAATGSRVSAFLSASALVLRDRQGAPRPPVDASFSCDLVVNPRVGDLDLSRFDLRVAEMSLSGSAHLLGSRTQPELRALAVSSHEVTFERLEPWLSGLALPSGSVLRGPLSLSAQATRAPDGASSVVAQIDLSQARVYVPGWVDKREDTALSAEFTGRLQTGRATIERLGVVLGPLRVLLHGEARSSRDFDVSFDSGEVPIDPVLRLLPRVRRAVPSGASLAGILRASGSLRAIDGDRAGHATLALRGAHASTQDFALEGDADASVSVSSRHRTLDVDASIIADHARVRLAQQLDKPLGAPMRLTLQIARTGHHIDVRHAAATLPGAHIEGRATYDTATRAVTLNATAHELDLARLLPVLPSGAERVPSVFAAATIPFSLVVEGHSGDLASAHAHLDLDAHSALGRLRGDVDLTGLDAPRRVRFALSSDAIDLGAMPSSSAPPTLARDLDLQGTLHVDALRRGAVTLSNLNVDLSALDGRLAFRTLRFHVAGGEIRADRSAIDLSGSTRRAEIHLRADHLDAAELADLNDVDPARRPSGSVDLDVDLSASGDDAAAMQSSAVGRVQVGATELVAHHVASPEVSIVLPIVGSRPLPERGRSGAPEQPLVIHSLRAQVALDHGALRTLSPATLRLDLGEVSLAGTIGADHALSLAGTAHVSPAAIAQATRGARLPAGTVPVAIRVTGTTATPRIEIADLGATLRALAGSRLRALGRALLP